MYDRRKGFTLVELLIAMVVIGVLAAMMMFSSTEAEISARAQNVINNFNQITKAVNSWYFDNLDRIKITRDTTSGKKDTYNIKIRDANGNEQDLGDFISGEITQYLSSNNPIELKVKEDTNAGDYVLIDYGKNWYVCYDTGDDTRLQSKFAGRAKTIGLYGLNSDVINNNSVVKDGNYTGGKYVCMFVLDLDN